MTSDTPESAKQQYERLRSEEEGDPIERLRFFCSLAMNGQDWLDVEPFFDAVIRQRNDNWIDRDTAIRERDELKHDIERHVQIATTLATEADRYKAERDGLRETIELVRDCAAQEWQEEDGTRKGATDNQGRRMWFIGQDIKDEIDAAARTT